MGDWNRSRHARGRRDRRHWRPPLPPPAYGHEHCPVPLWERDFCCYVGNISWQRFCENKHYVGPFNNLDHWDDSGALKNFQKVKARFCANYHGQPSDIPLPDPDLYIDKVNQHCKVNPELVADLEKVRLPFDTDDDSAAATEADKNSSQNQSGNWDTYIEKPAEINRWESELDSKPSATWGVEQEPFNNLGYSNYGWGNALEDPLWRSAGNNWNDIPAGSSSRYQDRSNMSGRKQNSRGHYRRGSSKQRNQAEGSERSGWQDQGWRNREWRPVHRRDNQRGQGF